MTYDNETGMKMDEVPQDNDTNVKKDPFMDPFAEPNVKKFGLKLAAEVSNIRASGMSGPSTVHYAYVELAFAHLLGMDVEGVGANAAYVSSSGQQGNISEMRVPQAAAMLDKVFNLVVAGEVTWSAVATTTDTSSEAQTIVAKNALAYYWKDKGTEPKAKLVAHDALSFGEGAMHIPWDPDLGEPIGMNKSGMAVHIGDIDYRPVSTWNIIRDPTAKSWDSMDWIIVEEYQDKYKVAAKCKTDVAKRACIKGSNINYNEECQWAPWNRNDQYETRLIPVFYFYHKDTASVPGGRQTKFLANGTVLSDSVLDEAYRERLPVVRMNAGNTPNTAFPYTPFFATLGMQQAADSMFRDILTNNQAISKGLVWVSSLNESPQFNLTSGPQLLVAKSPEDKPPQVLNLQTPNTESYQMINSLQKQMAQIWGLDELSRGESSGAGLSGVSMVTMVQTTVQNNSQLQANWAKFLTEVGEVTLAHIKYHMAQPRKVALAGSARKSLVTSVDLSAEAIQGVDRVRVDLASAMESTESGRFELANVALKNGWVQVPEDFQLVSDTGRLDALTQDLSNELVCVNQENDQLAKSVKPIAIATENHKLHILKHKAVLNTSAAKSNKAVVDVVLAHIEEHEALWSTTDPQKLAMMGIPPCPPPSAVSSGGAPGPMPGGAGSPPVAPNPSPGPMNGPPPPQGHPMTPPPNFAAQSGPQVAGFPKNPLAGNPKNPPGMPPALTAAPGQIGQLPPSLTKH